MIENHLTRSFVLSVAAVGSGATGVWGGGGTGARGRSQPMDRANSVRGKRVRSSEEGEGGEKDIDEDPACRGMVEMYHSVEEGIRDPRRPLRRIHCCTMAEWTREARGQGEKAATHVQNMPRAESIGVCDDNLLSRCVCSRDLKNFCSSCTFISDSESSMIDVSSGVTCSLLVGNQRERRIMREQDGGEQTGVAGGATRNDAV